MEIQLETIMDFPLFAGIAEADLPAMLQCLGYRVERYRKGEFLAIEGEPIQQIGVILQGRVDMLKEDFWGHKMILMRMQKARPLPLAATLRRRSAFGPPTIPLFCCCPFNGCCTPVTVPAPFITGWWKIWCSFWPIKIRS